MNFQSIYVTEFTILEVTTNLSFDVEKKSSAEPKSKKRASAEQKKEKPKPKKKVSMKQKKGKSKPKKAIKRNSIDSKRGKK